jgi:hypothetical protein
MKNKLLFSAIGLLFFLGINRIFHLINLNKWVVYTLILTFLSLIVVLIVKTIGNTNT